MSISGARKTGLLAELQVAQCFVEWGWLYGRDRLDEGYDLSVEPNRAKFNGARFLVQVKGTAKKSGRSITAQVSKARLREYATNPIPVVIVRTTADGTHYWVHAQDWTRKNQHKLAGNGNAGVRFEPSQTLSDKVGFEALLNRVLTPAAERAGALRELAEERGRHLSSLDPRLQVRVGVREGSETYEVFAAKEEIQADLKFRALGTAENIESLKEAIDFGLSRDIQVEGFGITGSPLFDAIGIRQDHQGTLRMAAYKRHVGLVTLRPGATYSLLSPEYVVPSDLTAGQRGAAVTNEGYDDIINLDIRIVSEDGRGRGEITIGFRSASLASKPIGALTALRGLGDWAAGMANESALFAELSFRGAKAPLVVRDRSIKDWLFIKSAMILGRLHSVARALDSDFVLPERHSFDRSDLSDLSLAYALLRGERQEIGLGPFEVAPNAQTRIEGNGEFLITTTLTFVFLGKEIGSIPVSIELPGYLAESVAGSENIRIVKGPNAKAWIKYRETADSGS